MSSIIHLTLYLITLATVCLAIEWPYRDCAGKEITSLRIDPCPKSPCKFNPGDQVNITVEFVANQDTDWVKLQGSLRTGGLFSVTVPYIGIDENACNKGFSPHKLPCPLRKGQKYKFVLTQTVPYYSRFNVFRYSTWKLVASRSNTDLTCAEFDIYQDVHLNRYFSQFAGTK